MSTIQKLVMTTLLSQLTSTKLEQYDNHFELVLTAIKAKDLEKLEQFYSAYNIVDNHPLRVVIDRLIEPVETVTSLALVSDNTDNTHDLSN